MDTKSFNTIQLMVSSWSNFAKTGNPSVEAMNVSWPVVSSEDHILMGLNINEKENFIMDFPETVRMKVFHEIWEMEQVDLH